MSWGWTSTALGLLDICLNKKLGTDRDPKTENYFEYPTYNHVLNNPIYFVDINGKLNSKWSSDSKIINTSKNVSYIKHH